MIFNLFSKKKNDGSGNVSKKICISRYWGGEFETLADAVQSLIEHNDAFHLGDILQYNIRYRRYCREHGVDETVELMLREAPALRTHEKAINEIYHRYDQIEPLGDYDIQCYKINDCVVLFGKEIHGLEQFQECSEVFMSEFSKNVWHPEKARPTIEGLHIGHMFESYPKFDSSDWGDDRTYQNYIIRTHPISKAEMMKLYDLPSEGNAIRVTEHIPENMLPMVYYSGTGDYMLLATKKEG